MRSGLRSAAGRIARSTPAAVKDALGPWVRYAVRDVHSWAPTHRQWLREVMNRDVALVFASLGPEQLHVVEISGDSWQGLPWKSYTRLDYPAFDLCHPPDDVDPRYDLVICEQVLEHVTDPLNAVRTLRRLCSDEWRVYVSTPFLVALHGHPGDYWRFTPSGLRCLLESQGLSPLWVRSWGNRQVVTASFDRWAPYRRWKTLKNEAHLPAVVWALAARS
jgi:SAM-dependent methyltransferase